MEVTAVLTIPEEKNVTIVEQKLALFNQSGKLGNVPWTASYWGFEGNSVS